MSKIETEVDFTEPYPLGALFFSRLKFTMVMEKRIQCSHCGKGYRTKFSQGVTANFQECNHHPDWHYIHALRFPDGTVIIWECCKVEIVQRLLKNRIPASLKMPPGTPYNQELVQQRLSAPHPKWLDEMNRDLRNDSEFDQKAARHPRPELFNRE